MRLIDSHAHLQAPAFAEDRDEVVAAAGSAGVERILVPGLGRRPRRALGLAVGPRLDRCRRGGPPSRRCRGRTPTGRHRGWPREPVVVADRRDRPRLRPHPLPARAQLANLRRHLRLALDSASRRSCIAVPPAGRARRPGRTDRRAAGRGLRGRRPGDAFGDRPPAVLHSFSGPVDYAAAALELGLRDLVLRPRLPRAKRRRPEVRVSSRASGC